MGCNAFLQITYYEFSLHCKTLNEFFTLNCLVGRFMAFCSAEMKEIKKIKILTVNKVRA